MPGWGYQAHATPLPPLECDERVHIDRTMGRAQRASMLGQSEHDGGRVGTTAKDVISKARLPSGRYIYDDSTRDTCGQSRSRGAGVQHGHRLAHSTLGEKADKSTAQPGNSSICRFTGWLGRTRSFPLREATDKEVARPIRARAATRLNLVMTSSHRPSTLPQTPRVAFPGGTES